MNFTSLAAMSCIINAILCIAHVDVGHTETINTSDFIKSELSPIRLILRTSKRSYRAGEQIGIITYLENSTSDKSYYIARDLTGLFVSNSFHGILISIMDNENKDITRHAAADPMPGKEVLKIEELSLHYIVLGPTVIYGVKDSYDLYLRPGKYKLLAKYYEAAAFRWTEAERKSVSPPIWAQDIISNAVVIHVTK